MSISGIVSLLQIGINSGGGGIFLSSTTGKVLRKPHACSQLVCTPHQPHNASESTNWPKSEMSALLALVYKDPLHLNELVLFIVPPLDKTTGLSLLRILHCHQAIFISGSTVNRIHCLLCLQPSCLPTNLEKDCNIRGALSDDRESVHVLIFSTGDAWTATYNIIRSTFLI